MEMEQVKKVAKLNEDAMGNEEEVKVDDGGDERDDNEISDMDKLPNETLMKILDYLDEKELVKCRLLSRRWNKISCLLLQDKTQNNRYSKLIVHLKGNMECQIVTTKSLADFIDCFSPSEAEKSSGLHRPFPFSHFSVQSLKNMNVSHLCEFVSTFGPRMKTVSVNMKHQYISNFQGFWKLLFHFAPNIQHLKLDGDFCLTSIRLFDPVANFIAESDPNFQVVNPNQTFLKKLIKLEILSYCFGQFNGFMKDLLDNTPNLKQVSSSLRQSLDGNYYNSLEYLQVWQQLGKAHLVKHLEISCRSHSNLSPADLMKNLRLVNLRVDCSARFRSKEDLKSHINYIHHALKSSQNTLTSLSLDSLTDKFMARCFNEITALPNVRRLDLCFPASTIMEIGNSLEQLCQICSNITSLRLDRLQHDFSQVAPILWTRFRGLKSLKVYFNMRNRLNDVETVDSAISGYSPESIERIQTKLDDGISLEEARQGEQQNASILDLKDLRELEVGFIESLVDGPNLEDQVENSLFLKLLSQLHTKKWWVRNHREVFPSGLNSNSHLEMNEDDWVDDDFHFDFN